MPPGGPRTSPSATTWCARRPGREPLPAADHPQPAPALVRAPRARAQPGHELLLGRRAREVEALGEVVAEVAQDGHLLHALHTLGYELDAQRLRHRHGGPQDGRAVPGLVDLG